LSEALSERFETTDVILRLNLDSGQTLGLARSGVKGKPAPARSSELGFGGEGRSGRSLGGGLRGHLGLGLGGFLLGIEFGLGGGCQLVGIDLRLAGYLGLFL
jgi:hypothetical protein